MLNTIITDEGVSQSIIAQSNQGYNIKLLEFSVSSSKGLLESTRTAVNNPADVWYPNTAISGFSKVDANTIELAMSIPPGSALAVQQAQEVYIWAQKPNLDIFLFAIVQPDPIQLYDPVGLLTFKLSFRLSNVDISSTYTFNNTIAAELLTHNNDSMAHAALRSQIEVAGAYVTLGDRRWTGQTFDQFPAKKVSVIDQSAVYWDAGNSDYGLAQEDQSAAQRVLGLYNATKDVVIFGGVAEYTHSLDDLTPLYLSQTTGGALTTTEGRYLVGYALPNNTIYVAIQDTETFGKRLYERVIQAAHGFSVGDQVFRNALGVVEAADITNDTKLRSHTVVKVVSPNEILIQKIGRAFVPAHGFVVGEYYFGTNTGLGEVSDTYPGIGYNSPAFYVLDANYLDILSYSRPIFSGPNNTVYFGDADTDGSFRLRSDAGTLFIEKRVAGIWEARDEIV